MTNPMASSYLIHDKSYDLFMLNPCASMADQCCIVMCLAANPDYRVFSLLVLTLVLIA